MASAPPLSIEVRGNSATCRGCARWLTTVASAVDHVGTQLYQSRSESETGWQGSAGDAFRDNVGKVARDTDELSQRATSVSQALVTFADSLDSIKRQVANLRGMATSVGLMVTDVVIMPPGPEPGGAPVMPSNGADPGAGQQYQQQQAAYEVAYGAWQSKVQAFQEASTTMAQLREREAEAHQTLAGVLKNPMFIDKYGLTILAKAESTISTAHTVVNQNIEQLKGKLDDIDAQLTKTQGAMRSAAAGERQAATAEAVALQSARGNAAEALADMQQVGKATRAMGGRVTTASAADFIEGASTVGKIARPVAEKLPYVGVGLTALSAGADIAQGKPAAKEIEKGVGDTAASIAAGAAVGTCVGGPVGTVVGAAAGLVASYGVDNLVDWKNGPVEQFNRWMGWE
jgi:hypothetical protein